MQLKTILNRVQKFKSFVYADVRWTGGVESPELEVTVIERVNGRPLCSRYGQPRPGYDRLPTRRFEFEPLRGPISNWRRPTNQRCLHDSVE